MDYNFDNVINRKNTDSIKYDFNTMYKMPEDILPLWVADMDFKVPQAVVEALTMKSQHGIFGYSETKSDYFDILKEWFSRYFNWDIHPDWLIKTPGVVFAINMAIRALTNESDAVIIQEPVYYPFSKAIINNNRKLVINELNYSNHKYSIDFDDFECKIKEHQVKLFILCNPHNPVGRVWTKEELTRLGDICLKYNVAVISDEIHADFIYPGYQHLVFADLKHEYKNITVTCTAPSKTFNLAGLQISNIFIANQQMKRKLKKEMVKTGYNQVNVMGIVACKAAYSDGHKWLASLKKYLLENLNFVRGFIQEQLPQIKLVEPEGTYLVWLDMSSLGLSDEELNDLIVHKAGLWLDAGTMFGKGGRGFQRINIATPRPILQQALHQLVFAIDSIGS